MRAGLKLRGLWSCFFMARYSLPSNGFRDQLATLDTVLNWETRPLEERAKRSCGMGLPEVLSAAHGAQRYDGWGELESCEQVCR